MIALSQVADPLYNIEQMNGSYRFLGGELPGVWAGTGAGILGLEGEVGEEPFLKLTEGIDPRTNVHLYQQNGKKHRPAIDVVMSPDKSVTITWARANEKLRIEIEKAHHSSVLETLKFLELHAAYTRRGKDGTVHQKVVGLISAVFQHSTSRSQDCQLHSHLTVINAAKRFDGSYGTLESRYIFKWQKAASLIYRAKLAELLRDLKIDTISTRQSFKVKGIPEPICDHFSKRRKQILSALDAKGIHTARAAALVAKITRGKKQAINRPELFNTWQSEMDELGFTENELNSYFKNSLGIHIPAEQDLTSVKFNHQYLSEVLTESASIFTEVDVYTVALDVSMKLAIPSKIAVQLAETFLESELILELQTDKKYDRQFTTHEMRNLENQLVKNAQELKNRTFLSGLSMKDITKSEIDTGLKLSEEQQEAVLGVLGNASLEIMSGSAGSGKSTAMKVVADVYSSRRVNVWGAAIAKAAAKNLENETGVQSFTIAKLILDLENGWSKIRHGDIVIVDESGQVGVRQILKLQEYAINKGFKVILTGDALQLEAIENGGVLRFLSRPEVIGTTRIETIRRQNQEWDRTAVANFRDGKATEGLKKYHNHKRLHFNKDIDSTYSALVADWNKYRQENPNKKSMVLARTWNDVLELNSLMRSQLQSCGEVEKQDLEIKGLVGSREINFLLSVNDRVRFTRNDSNLGFTNGDIGTVIKVIKDSDDLINITIKRDDGQLVTVTQSNYSNNKGQIYLAPSYAQTIYSSQGQTVDGAFVLHDQMIDRANAYVALSRHKDGCHLYATLDAFFEDGEAPAGIQATNKKAIEKIAEQYSSEKRATLSIEFEPKVQEVSKTEIEKSDIEYELDLA